MVFILQGEARVDFPNRVSKRDGHKSGVKHKFTSQGVTKQGVIMQGVRKQEVT
jgi:hypothetical protein